MCHLSLLGVWKNKNKLRTIYLKNHENFKNSKLRVHKNKKRVIKKEFSQKYKDPFKVKN